MKQISQLKQSKYNFESYSLVYDSHVPAILCVDGLNSRVTMTALQRFPNFQQSGATINIVHEIAGSGVYEEFGTSLLQDKHGTEMKIMTDKYSDNPLKVITEVFEMWTVQGKGQNPKTWKTLVTCLRGVLLNTLADDIENFFPEPKDKMFTISNVPPSSCASKCTS